MSEARSRRRPLKKARSSGSQVADPIHPINPKNPRKRLDQRLVDERPGESGGGRPGVVLAGAGGGGGGARHRRRCGPRPFFTDTATTEIYALSLHDAFPISRGCAPACATSSG